MTRGDRSAARRNRAARAVVALAGLDVGVEEIGCERGAIPVASYGGLRPTSTVVLRGAGVEGRGEHVGWTVAAHAAFARAAVAVPRGRTTVGELSAALRERVAEAYDRAALEAAAIDLALRQRGTNLFRLARVAPRAVRYVVSFARLADAEEELTRAPHIELKIDAEAGVDARRYASLRGLAIVDFKGTGTAAAHERVRRAVPHALLEDPRPPWSRAIRRRLSVDGPITAAARIRRFRLRPAAVNLKPARMGGVLEALRAAADCHERGIAIYLGGMFEIGVGRHQLRVLAALLSPDGPNDIAPIAVGDARPSRPARLSIDADAEGFA